jgi:hypothetical protein
MKIVTSFIYPPIPIRRFDWMAHIDGDEEGPTGYGETEADALSDLALTLAEKSAEGVSAARNGVMTDDTPIKPAA